MTEVRSIAALAVPLDPLIARAREEVPALVEEIVAEIQAEVGTYSGPSVGDRHRLIALAVNAAITQFLDLLEDDGLGNRKVDELFRQMGYGEARDGHSLDPMRSALRIATRQAWTRVRDFAVQQDLPASTVIRLTDALFGYLDHLDEQVTQGYQWGIQENPEDPELARDQLLHSLLEDVPPSDARRAELAAHAETADWKLPSRVVVMRATFHGRFPGVALPGDYLIDTARSPALIVCDATAAEELALAVSRAAPGLRVATSWPVAPEHAADGDRWATRALDLVAKGVLPPLPIIDCPDHAVQLWLHSEPLLRGRLAQDLLAPLLAETPNSREILSETMLAWLESRDSAPAIAARLGVHPQTVRYRWKRINELFGEQLHDPEFVITVTMLLKATVPMWRAGDRRDIEHFRATTGAT